MVNININGEIIPSSSIVSINIEHDINMIPIIKNKICKFYVLFYLIDGRKIRYNLGIELKILDSISEDDYYDIIEKQKETLRNDISNSIWNNKIITLKIEKKINNKR